MLFLNLRSEKVASAVQFESRNSSGKCLIRIIPEITNYKCQITNKFQISNRIKRQFFGILNFGHCDLFGICVLLFEIYLLKPFVSYNMLSAKTRYGPNVRLLPNSRAKARTSAI